MASLGDYIAHVQGLGLSVAIVDHDVVELNGRVDHAQLQKMKASVRAAYLDVISGMDLLSYLGHQISSRERSR